MSRPNWDYDPDPMAWEREEARSARDEAGAQGYPTRMPTKVELRAELSKEDFYD